MAVTREDSSRADTLAVSVAGMECESCEATLRRGLGTLDGVSDVDVDLTAGRVVLSGAPGELNVARAHARIGELGYQVTDQPPPEAGRWTPWELGLAVVLVVLAGAVAFQLGSDAYFSPGTLADLNDTIGEISLIGIGIAFALGLVVGFGPPTYAMAPALMGYVSGSAATSTRRTVKLAAAFVGGLVLVDLIVGAAFGLAGTAAIAFLSSRLALWYGIAALLLLALALVNLRVWRPRLPSWQPGERSPRSPAGAFALGVPFGLMACPGCTPLLLPVALGAATSGSWIYGAGLMGAFALGRGLPVGLLGVSAGAFRRALGVRRLVPWLERFTGILLLAAAAWFTAQFFGAGGLEGLW